MTAAMASMTGMIMNRPGPFTLDNLPARRITKRSQLFAILSEKAVSAARMPKPMPGKSKWARNNIAPMAPRTTVMSRVMGFMDQGLRI